MQTSERRPAAWAAILPLGAGRNAEGHMAIGGCDCVALAQEYGTPLYVYDEGTIRTRCREYVAGMRAAYADSLVIFAAMIINLMSAASAGVLVPLTLKRMRLDPALAGGVILTTVTDVMGFFSFLGLATLVLLR